MGRHNHQIESLLIRLAIHGKQQSSTGASNPSKRRIVHSHSCSTAQTQWQLSQSPQNPPTLMRPRSRCEAAPNALVHVSLSATRGTNARGSCARA
eukprot:5130287-Pleurochrysis_carterae.AAC.2